MHLRYLRICQMTTIDSNPSCDRQSMGCHGRRFGGALTTVIILLVVVVGLGTAGFLLLGGNEVEQTAGTFDEADIHVVGRNSFDIVIPASGELSTERKIEIRNRLEGRALITEIVSEGESVRAGDILLRLVPEYTTLPVG